MARTALIAVVLLLGASIGSAQADSLFPGGPRFDGTIKLLNLSGASCPPGQLGQVFPAVYRTKRKPTSTGSEGMSIAIPALAGALYMVPARDGTFAGTNQPVDGTFILDAWRSALPAMVFNLDFNPNTITGDTPDFTFKGTIQNYTFPGCVATVRGTFILR
jgi:hypothetical protein